MKLIELGLNNMLLISQVVYSSMKNYYSKTPLQ